MNNEEHINWKMKGDEVKEMSNNTLFAILAALYGISRSYVSRGAYCK